MKQLTRRARILLLRWRESRATCRAGGIADGRYCNTAPLLAQLIVHAHLLLREILDYSLTFSIQAFKVFMKQLTFLGQVSVLVASV